MSTQADIGLIGLAVMGENLVMNMASKGFTVAVYNRSTDKVTHFVEGRAKGKQIIGTYNLVELVASLKRPRKIMVMVKAGPAVDAVFEQLIPLLEPGDILIDGGNSHFPDTIRRTAWIESQGLLFIGSGVSGGEEGALLGPSIMPGGSAAAWPAVKPIFQAIAAKVDGGAPCCEWVGADGAGHFVKMVHNGIEYGDMQLICEAYHLMKDQLSLSAAEMQAVFADWNRGELDSYLIEITRDIMGVKDADGSPLIDHILDAAGQKGTGKWTSVAALDEGIPLTLIGEAVFARSLSAAKEERVAASAILAGPSATGATSARPALSPAERQTFIDDLRQALLAAKIVSYAQGYSLMRAAATTHNWQLNYGNIALLWRGGCIIRSAFLGKIKEAYDKQPELPNLMLDSYFRDQLASAQTGWRRVCATAMMHGIPVPTLSAALAYYDGYRAARLPANLLQAQRDYFGAHTYERTDQPRGQFFHTNWTGRGGDTASSTYNA